MDIVDSFEEKKIIHLMIEKKYNKYLFVLPELNSLKNFDPILKFLKEKYNKLQLSSGLLETIKNRKAMGNYVFINMLNIDILKDYDIIIKLPEIYDYTYYVPNIIGISSIPNLKMEDDNYVINYYGLNEFLMFNTHKDINIYECAPYIDFVKQNGTSVIMIGDPIKNADIVNLTKTNPIVMYRQNKPLIAALVRKAKGLVSKVDPRYDGVNYNFLDYAHEIELFESLK